MEEVNRAQKSFKKGGRKVFIRFRTKVYNRNPSGNNGFIKKKIHIFFKQQSRRRQMPATHFSLTKSPYLVIPPSLGDSLHLHFLNDTCPYPNSRLKKRRLTFLLQIPPRSLKPPSTQIPRDTDFGSSQLSFLCLI